MAKQVHTALKLYNKNGLYSMAQYLNLRHLLLLSLCIGITCTPEMCYKFVLWLFKRSLFFQKILKGFSLKA